MARSFSWYPNSSRTARRAVPHEKCLPYKLIKPNLGPEADGTGDGKLVSGVGPLDVEGGIGFRIPLGLGLPECIGESEPSLVIRVRI